MTNVTKESVFDAIYEEHLDRVYRTALHYSNDHYTAEEISQTVFMKLYINLENVNMDAVQKWLCTTAKHIAMNNKRDRKREILIDEVSYDEETLISDSLEDAFITELWEKEHSTLASRIFADLYCVNPRWYDAVTITYFLEKPQKEVADIMGIDTGALHSMLYRAKKWIKKNYEAHYNHLRGK